MPGLIPILGSLPSFAQPVNDDCASIIPVVIPTGTQVLFNGDNTGGTATGDAVPGSSIDDGFARVWHAFTLQDCGDVVIDYCGNAPIQSAVSSALMTGCPADDPVILAGAQSTTACGDGNQTLTYPGLPAGTYYLPVFAVFSPMGPYQVNVTAAPCTGTPANDECATALALIVNTPGDCPASALADYNAPATASSPAPACLGTASYQDVWYRFNPGADTIVSIHLEAITASEVGLEVFDGCGGPSLHCTIGTTLSETVAVAAFQEHMLRVFTQTDTGTSGSFGICISTPAPAVVCDGGSVTSDQGDTTIAICKDGLPDLFTFVTTSTASSSYAFFLSDPSDTVLSALNGAVLDTDTLPLGIYRVHGFSFEGTIAVPYIGSIIDSLVATGSCGAPSVDHVTLSVEICSGSMDHGSLPISLTPNPAFDRVTVRHASDEVLLIRLLDEVGREVFRTVAAPGATSTPLQLPASLPAGHYAVHCTGTGTTQRALLIVL